MDYEFDTKTEWAKRFSALCLAGELMYGAKVRFKDESRWMRFLGALLFFNRDFMTGYTTTLFRTVWFPSRADIVGSPEWAFQTLAHELVHVDRCGGKWLRWVWFSLKYLFPQCLALLSLGAVSAFWVGPIGLIPLLLLGSLLPWPAPFRVEEEIWGYAMSEVVKAWCRGRRWTGPVNNSWQGEFLKSGYYFMARNWEPVRKRIELRCGWMEGEGHWPLGAAIRTICLFGVDAYMASVKR
jgi:hypothetical protein